MYTKDGGGHVTLDQDEYIKRLGLIRHPELTGADADSTASKMVTDIVSKKRPTYKCDDWARLREVAGLP
eukprot:3182107-Pyramimonas_sp.AAC.1